MFSSQSDEVTDNIVGRIKEKMLKDYGSDVALVVRDSSGVDWDWEDEALSIRVRLNSVKNPFSRGVWVLSRTKDRLFQII